VLDHLLERRERGPGAALDPVDPEEQEQRAGEAELVTGRREHLQRLIRDPSRLVDHRARIRCKPKLQARHLAVHARGRVRMALQLRDQLRTFVDLARVLESRYAFENDDGPLRVILRQQRKGACKEVVGGREVAADRRLGPRCREAQGRPLLHVAVGVSELAAIACRLLEVVAEDLVELDQLLPM